MSKDRLRTPVASCVTGTKLVHDHEARPGHLADGFADTVLDVVPAPRTSSSVRVGQTTYKDHIRRLLAAEGLEQGRLPVKQWRQVTRSPASRLIQVVTSKCW